MHLSDAKTGVYEISANGPMGIDEKQALQWLLEVDKLKAQIEQVLKQKDMNWGRKHDEK